MESNPQTKSFFVDGLTIYCVNIVLRKSICIKERIFNRNLTSSPKKQVLFVWINITHQYKGYQRKEKRVCNLPVGYTRSDITTNNHIWTVDRRICC